MNKKVIEITNQEVINYLEGLNYEVESRANLLTHMTNTGVKPSNEAFKDYHKEYVDFFTKYQMAKMEFAEKYIYPEIEGANKDNTNWRLDFNTHECIIEVV